MLNKFKPKASTEQLLKFGSDITLKSRFNDTLSYNHFTTTDESNMESLAQLLESVLEEAADLFYGYTVNLLTYSDKPIERQLIEEYLRTFLNESRTEEYVERILPFFKELKLKGYNVSKLVVVFNQLHFLFVTHVLSEKGIFPHRCIELLESLQRAVNIDQQILVEVFTESMIESASDGMTQLMGKISDIIYVKDLLAKLEEQNELSHNVATAAQQMAASVDEVAHNAINVAEKTENVVKDTEQGKQIISVALNEIITSDKHFDQIIASFNELQNYLENIQNIVGLIDNIANQTQLLALNASIEAAHAGNIGSGFEVVAQEIRKLANSTMDSLKVVSKNVAEVSRVSESVSKSIYSTQHVIKRGVKEAEEALPLLTQITEEISEVNAATEKIAEISQEQAAAVNDVTDRIIQVAELTSNAKNLSIKTGNDVYELSKRIEAFRKTIFSNNIRLSTKALLQLTKSDHIMWKWRIYSMIMGYDKVDPEDVSSYRDCRLGKWYFSEESNRRFQKYQSYHNLDKPHQLVHQHARLAAEAYLKGDIHLAEKHLESIEQASQEVIAQIDMLISELD